MERENQTYLDMPMLCEHQRTGLKQVPHQGLPWGLNTLLMQALDIKSSFHYGSFLQPKKKKEKIRNTWQAELPEANQIGLIPAEHRYIQEKQQFHIFISDNFF